MFTFAALLAVASTSTPNVTPMSIACYASRDRSTEKIIVVTDAPKPNLTSRGLRRVACPESLDWTPENAKRQCGFLRHYDFSTAVAYIELHGISPEEVCQEGLRAAGLVIEETTKDE